MYRIIQKIYRKLLIATFFLCMITGAYAQQTNEKWNVEKEKQHLLNRQDSLTWDFDLLNNELNNEHKTKPFRYGVFPVPKYDLLGKDSFKGMGVNFDYRKLDNQEMNLLYSFFYVKRNELIEKYIPIGKSDEVFFTIIVLSDFIDTIKYSHIEGLISSRNNPDYIGQGLIRTKTDEIDYMAFLTADRNEYAIVNMRLFNLKHGRTILIAPQKDGSLRSMQLKSEQVLSSEDIEGYIDEILKQENVKKFFTR